MNPEDSCAHPTRNAGGVCTSCGDCPHDLILNLVCMACGATELTGTNKPSAPSPEAALIPASRLRRGPT